MKKIIIGLIFTLGALQAYGLECSSGILGEDDNFLKVVFNESSVEFQLHETFFEVTDLQIQSGFDRNYVIPTTTVNVTSEGETFKSEFTSMIIFQGLSANIYLNFDGLKESRILTCI